MNFSGRITVDEDEIRMIVAHHIAQHMRLPISPGAIVWTNADGVTPRAMIDIDTISGQGVKIDGKQ